MAGYQDLGESERTFIVGAREMGRNIFEVVMEFGFSRTTISRVYRGYRESEFRFRVVEGLLYKYDDAASEQKNAGRPPTTDNPARFNERHLISQVYPTSAKREVTRRQIYRPISKTEQAHHSSVGGKSVSCCLRKADLPKTVARRLRGGGLYARRPVVCVPLTRQHRTACLQWCREHHNWTEQDWACVLFSDESRFSLSSD
ncbi:HTH_Tnp_Tc3_2 domain-containing protein [Trichonephila clavipes]|nr:HTH_Tnp_Tc3_2 domain-containing protein [Trichonephila clavipes]